jgi:hypothetical protein
MLAHLGALEQGMERERNLRAVRQRIRQIESERIVWPSAFAAIGRAALHQLSGDRARRDRALARAVRLANALGYRPFAAVFARSQALLAGDGEAVAHCDRCLLELGISSPARWQRTWAPCLL